LNDEYLPDAPLFESARGVQLSNRSLFHILQKRFTDSGVEQKVSAIMFRFTYGNNKQKNGIDIRELQKLLGHSDTYLTQRFMYMIPDYTKE